MKLVCRVCSVCVVCLLQCKCHANIFVLFNHNFQFPQIIVWLAVVSVVFAAPIDEREQPQILRYENTNDGLGNYKFA